MGAHLLSQLLGRTGPADHDVQAVFQACIRGAVHHVSYAAHHGAEQGGETHKSGTCGLRCIDNTRHGHIHPEVDDLITVGRQDQPHDIFADLMDVSLHGCQDHLAAPGGIFRIHLLLQQGHCLLDHLACHDEIGKKVFPVFEPLPHGFQAFAEPLLNDLQRLDAFFKTRAYHIPDLIDLEINNSVLNCLNGFFHMCPP